MSGRNGAAAVAVNWATIGTVFSELAQVSRWCSWRTVTTDGKPRKVPFVASRKAAGASTTDPATWRTLAEARHRCEADGESQPGLMLGQLEDGRWLVGLDADLCRSPATGVLEPWVRQLADRCGTYAEVSPSGTGIKIFGTATSLPPGLREGGKEGTPPDAAIPAGTEDSGHTKPELSLFPFKRYFAATGHHLDGTPDELTDITEPLAELSHMVLSWSGQGAAEPRVDLGSLPDALRDLLEGDAKLKAAWLSGEKLDRGKDKSASGLDFSLMAYLARKEHEDDLIELAVRHYPHGQIGSGSLKGVNASRRIGGLLREAGKVRERAKRHRESDAWMSELIETEQGTPRDCLANGGIILRSDPAFSGKIRFDEHRQTTIYRDMPWQPGHDWREWGDRDDIRFAEWCQLRGVPISPATAANAVAAVADDQRTHPVREYLDGLAWDGKPRLSAWLFTYLGANVPDGGFPDEREEKARKAKRAYLREVGRRWLIAAAARIYKPGCKVDTVPILEGRQGTGKSQAIAALVPQAEWFTDEVADLGTKDAAQGLRGKWIIELGELSAMKRGEVETKKAFISRSVDHYRPSYGRRAQDFPRQCVFAGTTNAEAYLADETGNRRFWPAAVGKIDLDGLRRDRDQLWAEAVHAFKAGERWWLDADHEALAAEEQEDRRIADPWEESLLAGARVAVEGPVTVKAVLAWLGVPCERQDQAAANRVARIFKAHGWERYRSKAEGRPWAYRPCPTCQRCGARLSQLPGQEKASIRAVCPSCPTCPSRDETASATTTTTSGAVPPGGGGGSGRNFTENTGTNRDTGTNPPPWLADHDWISLWVRAGATLPKREPVLRAWLATAPPQPLPRCHPAVELARIARNHGIDVRVMP